MDPRKGDKQCMFCWKRPIRNESGVCDGCQEHMRKAKGEPKRCFCGRPIKEHEEECSICFFDRLRCTRICTKCQYVVAGIDNFGKCPNCGSAFNVQDLQTWLNGGNVNLIDVKRSLQEVLAEYLKLKG